PVEALDVARQGRTTRLGHMLAPMGVRYLVLPTRAAPGARGEVTPPPADIGMALQDQLDMRQVPSDPSILLYENVAWAPARAVLPAGAVDASHSTRPASAGSVDLAGADPALLKAHGPQSFTGPLGAGQEVLFAESTTGRWDLKVGGKKAAHRTAFGWANAYTAGAHGTGSLHYRTPVSRYLALVVALVLWALAIRTVVVLRRRRSDVPEPSAGGSDGDMLTEDDDGDGDPAGAALSLVSRAN